MSIATVALSLLLSASPAPGSEGILDVPSAYDVPKTADRIVRTLEARGFEIFARIDHAAGAKKAGLALRPMQLIVFGKPKAGTPLMQDTPRIGIDLPMKALIWEESGSGRTWVSLEEPGYLWRRHGLEGHKDTKDALTRLYRSLAQDLAARK